ncbi:MAG TPA: Hsp20/alpha crystallin family protein [Syntrophobacteraceae bacterium]|nr:Hsp20/alpha crystallin family protein [Syntrophobacteraceae bacterium]
MADTDLVIEEKKEVQATGESTRDVPVFVPAVDIYESENSLTLVADMPGVPMENVDIDLDSDQLTIRGRAPQHEEKGKALFKEYTYGDYYRQFTLSSDIDRERIQASMKDGVLKLVLPKAEAAKPRKITVMSS